MSTTAYMSVKEAAQLLGVRRHRVQELIHEHKLKASKSGRTWLISKGDFIAYTQGRPPESDETSAIEAAHMPDVSRQRGRRLIRQDKFMARKVDVATIVGGGALVAPKRVRDREVRAPTHLSVKEAAQLLGVSRQHIQQLIHEEKLMARKVGAGWIIKRSAALAQKYRPDAVPVAAPERGEWDAFTRLTPLGLPPEYIAELVSLGIEQVSDLPRLVGLAFEGPLGASHDAVMGRAAFVLGGLGPALHAAFLVRNEVDPLLSLHVDGDNVTYRLLLDSPTLRIETLTAVGESDVGDYLAQTRTVEAHSRARADLRRTIDPLDDLQYVLGNLGDLMDSNRLHTLDNPATLLEARFGLSGEPKMTLEQLGIRSGVTRERIRQRESKALRLLQRPWAAKRLMRISALILRLATQMETAPDDPLVALALRKAFPSTRVNAGAWLRLLSQIHGSDWGPPERRALPGVDAAIAFVLALSGPLGLDELVVEVAKRLEVAPDPSLRVRVQNSRLCNVDDAGVVQLPDADELDRTTVRVRRLNAMRQVLEADGPTHFSDLTRRIRPLLSSDDDILERNVHAWLDRYSDRFTWVGPGTYRLRQDGDPAPGRRPLPERYAPSRRRGIGDAIIALLLERQPRSLAEIESYIMPRFVVNEGSIRASIVQDRARRFVLTDDRSVYLSDADIAAFEAAKPKASGLIDWNELAVDIADFGEEVESDPTKQH